MATADYEPVTEGLAGTPNELSTTLGFAPFVGDALDAGSALSGVDLISGELLSVAGRGVSAFAVVVPFVGGKAPRELGKAVSAVSTRITRAGKRGVRATRSDGSVIDITEECVKEFVPESLARKGLKSVKFENALPGTKGKKRVPTEEELDFLKRFSG